MDPTLVCAKRGGADFWFRIHTSPIGRAYGPFVYDFLDFDADTRPTIADVSQTWVQRELAKLA